MKQLLPLLLVCAVIGCTPKHNISVKFNGFSNDTIVVSHKPYADYVSQSNTEFEHDTIILKNGIAKVNIDLTQTQYIWINNLQYHKVDEYHGMVYLHPAGKVTLVMND